MAQFAEQLQYLAGGYLDYPVADSTRLEGQYDFTLNFSPAGLIQSAKRSANTNTPDGATSDPSNLLSLEDALGRQLGLKIEPDRRPLPVLVIDHVDEKPSDNQAPYRPRLPRRAQSQAMAYHKSSPDQAHGKTTSDHL